MLLLSRVGSSPDFVSERPEVCVRMTTLKLKTCFGEGIDGLIDAVVHLPNSETEQPIAHLRTRSVVMRVGFHTVLATPFTK